MMKLRTMPLYPTDDSLVTLIGLAVVVLVIVSDTISGTVEWWKTSTRAFLTDKGNQLEVFLGVMYAAVLSLTVAAIYEHRSIAWTKQDEFVDCFTYAHILYARTVLFAILITANAVKLACFMRIKQIFALVALVIIGMFQRVFTYLVLLALWVLSFSLSCYLLFGSSWMQMSRPWDAFLNQFEGALGGLDLSPAEDEEGFIGWVVVMAFILSVSIVMLNLIIAIMNEAYGAVYEEAETQWCRTQYLMVKDAKNQHLCTHYLCAELPVFTDYLARCWRWFCRLFSTNNPHWSPAMSASGSGEDLDDGEYVEVEMRASAANEDDTEMLHTKSNRPRSREPSRLSDISDPPSPS